MRTASVHGNGGGGWASQSGWSKWPLVVIVAAMAGVSAWLRGHDGQAIAVIPSRDPVIVRMGLTPSRLAYGPQPLVAAIAAALP